MLGAVASVASSSLIISPPPTLAVPVFESVFTGSSVTDTLLAESITDLPASGALLVMAATRSTSADRSHGTPTLSGISISGSFSSIGSINEVQPATTNNVRVSMWIARLAASPGTGNVQMVCSGNVSQSLLAVYSIVGAGIPHATQGQNTGTAGTDLTVSFDDTGTPQAASMAIGIYAQNGAGGAGLAAAGFTNLANATVDFSTNMRVWAAYDLTSPANNIPFTGGQSNNAKSGVGVLLEQLT